MTDRNPLMRNVPEYRAWDGIIQRCTNPKNTSYGDYGGRGITVCAEWRASFAAFLFTVGKRPSRLYSIDRYPNNNGNYEPGNVRWANRKDQARNRRSSKLVVFEGREQCLADITERLGLKYGVVLKRLLAGIPLEAALSPVRIPMRTENLRGELASGAKLSESQVVEIRKLAKEGLMLKIIAQRFGMAPNTISMIVSRKKWTHVA